MRGARIVRPRAAASAGNDTMPVTSVGQVVRLRGAGMEVKAADSSARLLRSNVKSRSSPRAAPRPRAVVRNCRPAVPSVERRGAGLRGRNRWRCLSGRTGRALLVRVCVCVWIGPEFFRGKSEVNVT